MPGEPQALGLALGIWLTGCGADAPTRPIALDVQGLSARAAALVVKLFAPPGRPGCVSLTPVALPTAVATDEARWDRASGAARALSLDAVEGVDVTLAAYALDADGAVMQTACNEYTFSQLGQVPGGELTLVLSRRQD
jgi:hypothetical protein